MTIPATDMDARLQITLQLDIDQVIGVELTSSRPLQISRFFSNKTISEVLDLIQLLYHICGTAQAIAAVNASEQALGVEFCQSRDHARQLRCDIERLKEHLLQVLVHWPVKFEFPQESDVQPLILGFNKAQDALGADALLKPEQTPLNLNKVALINVLQTLTAAANTRIFGMPSEHWQAIHDYQALHRWMSTTNTVIAQILHQLDERGLAELGRCEVAALPPLDSTEVAQQLATQALFAAFPEWAGQPRETSCFSRQRHPQPLIQALESHFGNGLLTRMTARLTEIAQLLSTLGQQVEQLPEQLPSRAQRAQSDSGEGLSQVETARGRLLHWLRQRNGRIERYQIVAPTEWNCHPRGVLAQTLLQLPRAAAPALHRQALWLTQVIDPCVEYSIVLQSQGANHDA